MVLHPGLIVIVPNVTPATQRALFRAALQHIGKRELVNTVIEIDIEGEVVRCAEYEMPAD
jgi:hypothetical protein